MFFPLEVSVALWWAWKRQMIGTDRVRAFTCAYDRRERDEAIENIHKEITAK